MSRQNYSSELFISVKPDLVYRAITEGIDKWWTEFSSQALNVGDPLVVRFEKNTSWVMTVSEATPDRSLLWKVVEANHDLEELSKKDEWKGTAIKWEIVAYKNGSRVTLTHQGLVPTLECFEICRAGWSYFLGSLKDYLETGKGSPYKEAVTE